MTTFTKGLEEVGTGVYAYLAGTGTWGYSNAGLITEGDASLLVDTLFTLDLTREMLDEMARCVPAARAFDIVVNSHADPDHTWGNQLVGEAQIVATASAAEEMATGLSPEAVTQLQRSAAQLGPAGELIERAFSAFDFDGIRVTPPTMTFSGALTLDVGGRAVDLHDVGPAHSRGDLIVHDRTSRVAFVADLLFVGGHPAVWAGPIGNWVAVCDRIVGLEPEVVVPGHGPVTDVDGVREFRDYLLYLAGEAKRFHAMEIPAIEAARRIDLSPYASWTDAERVVLAIDSEYRVLSGDESPRDQMALLGAMGEMLD
jgi:cyclase